MGNVTCCPPSDGPRLSWAREDRPPLPRRVLVRCARLYTELHARRFGRALPVNVLTAEVPPSATRRDVVVDVLELRRPPVAFGTGQWKGIAELAMAMATIKLAEPYPKALRVPATCPPEVLDHLLGWEALSELEVAPDAAGTDPATARCVEQHVRARRLARLSVPHANGGVGTTRPWWSDEAQMWTVTASQNLSVLEVHVVGGARFSWLLWAAWTAGREEVCVHDVVEWPDKAELQQPQVREQLRSSNRGTTGHLACSWSWSGKQLVFEETQRFITAINIAGRRHGVANLSLTLGQHCLSYVDRWHGIQMVLTYLPLPTASLTIDLLNALTHPMAGTTIEPTLWATMTTLVARVCREKWTGVLCVRGAWARLRRSPAPAGDRFAVAVHQLLTTGTLRVQAGALPEPPPDPDDRQPVLTLKWNPQGSRQSFVRTCTAYMRWHLPWLAGMDAAEVLVPEELTMTADAWDWIARFLHLEPVTYGGVLWEVLVALDVLGATALLDQLLALAPFNAPPATVSDLVDGQDQQEIRADDRLLQLWGVAD